MGERCPLNEMSNAELDDDEAQMQAAELQVSLKARTKPILLIVGALVGCVLLAGVVHSQQASSDLAPQADISSSIDLDADISSIYGEASCPCIGIDNVEGTKKVGDATYPADLGARCSAWDDVEGKKDEWREQSWCYVDPCNCELKYPPKKQTYMPDARFRNRQVYYSYDTCGSEDLWTPKHNPKACTLQKGKDACEAQKAEDGSAKCDWNDDDRIAEVGCVGSEYAGMCKAEAPESKYGKDECRCAAIEHQQGTVKFDVGAKKVEYPLDLGSSCQAWDADSSVPACMGDKPADWCKKKWCYVDPCKCNLNEGPFVATYGDGKWKMGGHTTYYSYNTCGDANTFATHDDKFEKPDSCPKTD